MSVSCGLLILLQVSIVASNHAVVLYNLETTEAGLVVRQEIWNALTLKAAVPSLCISGDRFAKDNGTLPWVPHHFSDGLIETIWYRGALCHPDRDVEHGHAPFVSHRPIPESEKMHDASLFCATSGECVVTADNRITWLFLNDTHFSTEYDGASKAVVETQSHPVLVYHQRPDKYCFLFPAGTKCIYGEEYNDAVGLGIDRVCMITRYDRVLCCTAFSCQIISTKTKAARLESNLEMGVLLIHTLDAVLVYKHDPTNHELIHRTTVPMMSGAKATVLEWSTGRRLGAALMWANRTAVFVPLSRRKRYQKMQTQLNQSPRVWLEPCCHRLADRVRACIDHNTNHTTVYAETRMHRVASVDQVAMRILPLEIDPSHAHLVSVRTTDNDVLEPLVMAVRANSNAVIVSQPRDVLIDPHRPWHSHSMVRQQADVTTLADSIQLPMLNRTVTLPDAKAESIQINSIVSKIEQDGIATLKAHPPSEKDLTPHIGIAPALPSLKENIDHAKHKLIPLLRPMKTWGIPLRLDEQMDDSMEINACHVASRAGMTNVQYTDLTRDLHKDSLFETLGDALQKCSDKRRIYLHTPRIEESISTISLSKSTVPLSIIGKSIRARCLECETRPYAYADIDTLTVTLAGSMRVIMRMRSIHLERIHFDMRVPGRVYIHTGACLHLNAVSFTITGPRTDTLKESPVELQSGHIARDECTSWASRIGVATRLDSTAPGPGSNTLGSEPKSVVHWQSWGTLRADRWSCAHTEPNTCLAVYTPAQRVSVAELIGMHCGSATSPCFLFRRLGTDPFQDSKAELDVDTAVFTEAVPVGIGVFGFHRVAPQHIKNNQVGVRMLLPGETKARTAEEMHPSSDIMNTLRQAYFFNREYSERTDMLALGDTDPSHAITCQNGCGYKASLLLYHDPTHRSRHYPGHDRIPFRTNQTVYGRLAIEDLSDAQKQSGEFELTILRIEICSHAENADGKIAHYDSNVPWQGGCHSVNEHLLKHTAVYQYRDKYATYSPEHSVYIQTHDDPAKRHFVYFSFSPNSMETFRGRESTLQISYDVVHKGIPSVPSSAYFSRWITPDSTNPSQIVTTQLEVTCAPTHYFLSSAAEQEPYYLIGSCRKRLFSEQAYDDAWIYVWSISGGLVLLVCIVGTIRFREYNSYKQRERNLATRLVYLAYSAHPENQE